MKGILTVGVVLAEACLVSPALAVDPNGTWSSTITFQNQPLENSLKLRLDTESSSLSGGYRDGLSRGEIPIANVSFKQREISFVVVREMSGQRFALKYKGALVGDTISGKCIIDYGDRTQSTESTDWIATRQR